VANANSIPLSNNNNGSDTAIGAAGVSLRAFDARATLVLIDGRRVAPYPITNSGIAFVDLFSIPRDAIETIEILKDGASTTYGADAVAGVVNIKLRKDYRGAEFNVEYGNTTEEDSSQFAASLVFGVGNEKTNITGVLNYYHRNSIANRDRDYSAVPPFLSSNASPYNLQLTNLAVAEAGGTVIPRPSGLQFAGAPSGTNGLAPASAYLYSGTARIRSATGILPGFNFNEFSLSFPESERYGGYLSASHKIYGDQLIAYADGYYQNVKTHNELAPPATGNFQTTGATTIAIPPRVPNPAGTTPFGGPTYAATGVAPGAFNPFNPFNQIISGGSRARLAEFGNRLFDNETDAVLTTIGLRGDKLFNGTWGYDLGFRYSEVKNLSTGQQVSISRFNRILNQADPIFNPASSQFIGTTVAFNPFGDFRVPIPSNQASLEFARVFPKDFDISKVATLDGSIYTTELFRLPAGGVGFAAGAQFRRESLREEPDDLNFNGDIAGNSPLPAARGGRKSYAIYAETSIPIFSPDNAIAGFQSLELTAAVRYEEFRNNNSNVVVPKFGLRWQPLDESLTLRATWGKGFRQPALEELFGSGANSIEGTIDPLTGLSEPETTTISNSNALLQPEDSESISAGLVYTPKFVPGLTLSIDFFNIERTGVVIIPEAQQVLEREAAGGLLPGEQVIRNPDGSINVVIRADQNAGFEKSRGADFGLQYVRETPWGTFTWVTQATFLDEFLRQQTPLDPVEHLTRGPATDASDEATTSGEATPAWNGPGRGSASWEGCATTMDFTSVISAGANTG
jgi:outer membrane receptor protein involved in Fe transport